MRQLRGTFCEIDLDRLVQNYKVFEKFFGHTFVCPMVKANAYGHGDIEVARTLSHAGAKNFGVVTLEEAIHLRESGIQGEILIFGVLPRQDLELLSQYNVTPVLSDWREIEDLERQLKSLHAVHIKFNTGLNRLGFPMEDCERLVQKAQLSSKLKVKGVCTHLIRGDDLLQEDGLSRRQLLEFEYLQKIWKPLNPVFHAYNSASAIAVMNSKGLFSNSIGVRPGIALYGYGHLQALGYQFQPVLSLKSQLLRLQHVPKGSAVSYNATWIAKRDSLVGVVAVGYADGIHRALSNKFEMLVHGHRLPSVGTVCMDYVMVDLTEIQHLHPKPFDEVVLIGQQGEHFIGADELAAQAGTISYEILTHLGPRLPRLYKRPPTLFEAPLDV